MSGLWCYVEGTPAAPKDEEKLKARAMLVLLVDPVIYVHIQDAKSAKEVWDNLKKAFDDSGLLRRVNLLRELVSTRLIDCSSMEEFVNKIIVTAHKLKGAGMEINDEWIGVLLLAGLGNEFKPMIMAIENSNVGITSDFVKTKLLQEVKGESFAGSSTVVLARKQKKAHPNQKKEIKCYGCQEVGHYVNKCPNFTRDSKHKAGNHKSVLSCLALSALSRDEWYIDSGASVHMTCNMNWMENSKPIAGDEVTIANNMKLKSELCGDVQLPLKINQAKVITTIKDAIYVPNLCTNLLSVSQLIKKGLTIEFDDDGCKVFRKNDLLVHAELIDGMFKVVQANSSALVVNKMISQELWHRRFGHLGNDNLLKLKGGFVDGIDFTREDRQICETCDQGKQTRRPFKESKSHSNTFLELVHSDVCGPMTAITFGGSRYFVTFIDDFSHKVFIYFLKNKSDVFDAFKEFKNYAENQSGHKIKIFRTDNGTEYVNGMFDSFLKNSGIHHQLTAPYTPEQNGTSERMNRTLVERARCMLFDGKLSTRFWGEAVKAAGYLVNRSPCRGDSESTPEEIWLGRKPDVSHLRVFGCKALVHIPKQNEPSLTQNRLNVLWSDTVTIRRHTGCSTRRLKRSSLVVMLFFWRIIIRQKR